MMTTKLKELSRDADAAVGNLRRSIRNDDQDQLVEAVRSLYQVSRNLLLEVEQEPLLLNKA